MARHTQYITAGKYKLNNPEKISPHIPEILVNPDYRKGEVNVVYIPP